MAAIESASCVLSTARETPIALAIKNSRPQSIDGIEQEPAIYGAGFRQLEEVVERIPDHIRVALVVGHNPGFESLVEGLTGESYVVMKTCSLAVLEGLSLSWASQDRPAFRLLQLYHPRELPDSF